MILVALALVFALGVLSGRAVERWDQRERRERDARLGRVFWR